MKIAIIISGNSYRSHLNYFINFLKEHKIDFDIISWNRKMINESGTISYNFKQSEKRGYFYRLISYFGYRKFVLNNLKKSDYDRIIISTIAIGILLYPYLKKHYKQKYIFDIRDYSLIIKFSHYIFRKLIENSACTVISSNGFKQWLPPNLIYFNTHNFPFDLTHGDIQDFIAARDLAKAINPIEISAIGSLRDYEANKLLIDTLCSSNLFILNFIGLGPAYEPLLNYVKIKRIINASFYGYYEKEDEVHLLKNTHLINNYTNDDLNSRTLTTNRFYLSVFLGIPMIVRHGTYQAKLCQLYNIGCILNPDSDIKNQLLGYLSSYNVEEYNKGRADFLSLVAQDTCKLDDFLMDFIKPDDKQFI